MHRYYDEANETEMWSNLCVLADEAVMVAENEEEIKKTRETRSQQNHENLNASSPLFDLNEIPTDHSMQENPRNHSQRLSDEEKRSRKGKSKIVSEEEDEDEKEESEERLFQKTMKKFARRSRTYPQRICENLNGASTSSSHVLNTAESEKTGTRSPPNPKYQSSPSSRKQRAVMISGQVKKPKVAPLPEREPREIPEWLVRTMREMNGAEDPRLIFDTALTTSDVNPSQSRLLIPFKKLITNDFLTLEEAGAIWRKTVTQEDEEINGGLGTILFNQRSEKWGLRFKVWVMKKKSGKETLNYALNWDWNEFVERNDLKASDKIRLWTFRWGGFLCFALDTDTE